MSASSDYEGTYVYDFCNPDMITFYKEVILARFMDSKDVSGVFFDEIDSFVEGGYGNLAWAGQGGPNIYYFSASRKAQLMEVSFQWMNSDFLLKNPDSSLTIPDFLVKNMIS